MLRIRISGNRRFEGSQFLHSLKVFWVPLANLTGIPHSHQAPHRENLFQKKRKFKLESPRLLDIQLSGVLYTH